MDLLEGHFVVDRNFEKFPTAIFQRNPLILYYFTNLDSESCRVFDKVLTEIMDNAAKRGIDIAVIIVLMDSEDNTLQQAMSMHYPDYFAIPDEDELIHVLRFAYGVNHVPELIVVKPNGTVVSRIGCMELENKGFNAVLTWL